MTGTGRHEILVVCIGNEMVADDAVGYEVHARLQEADLPAGTRLAYVGVGGIAILDMLEGTEQALVVVDAVQFGAAPGTVHQLNWEEIPLAGPSAISAHGIGIREAIAVGNVLFPERIPPQIFLIGIEGRCFDLLRHAMSAEVEAAIDVAVQAITGKLRLIHGGG